MTNPNYSHISFVLDRSGSMTPVAKDVIGGFNQFLKDQQSLPGKATIHLVQFDHEYETLISFKELSEAKPLDETSYVPRGLTALLDAIGRTIVVTGEKLSALPEDERPGKVIFVIYTDGLENNSQEYKNPATIKEMIDRQTKEYNWQFIYLGANQDAFSVAKDMGVPSGSTSNYAPGASAGAFAVASSSTRRYRASEDSSITITDEERNSISGDAK